MRWPACCLGFVLWAYTLMLPSVAKSGWLAVGFVNDGPWGLALLKPEQLLGLSGLDNLTHALFWSLLANVAAYVALSLWRPPSAREAEPGARCSSTSSTPRPAAAPPARCSGAGAPRFASCCR